MGIRDAGIEEIIARDSLRRLVTTYSRAADRRDFALMRSLYHDDAFDHHGGMFAGGADGYIEFVKKAISAYEMTVHYVVNMSFEIDGDQAEGEVHKINYHRTKKPDTYEIITGSRSLDRYARRDGEWRFLSRSITLDWAQRRAVDPADYDTFEARSPRGSIGPDDLSYSLLKSFARHPG